MLYMVNMLLFFTCNKYLYLMNNYFFFYFVYFWRRTHSDIITRCCIVPIDLSVLIECLFGNGVADNLYGWGMYT